MPCKVAVDVTLTVVHIVARPGCHILETVHFWNLFDSDGIVIALDLTDREVVAMTLRVSPAVSLPGCRC